MEVSREYVPGFYNPRDDTNSMRVLITHPGLEDSGGVAGYWRQLQGKFGVSTEHFTIGKRPAERGILSKTHRILGDYRRFARRLRRGNIDIVHLNPSLDPKSFVRDGIFSLLARMRGKKTVVFFHGWQASFETRISRGFVWLFKLFFGNAEAFIVLSKSFKETLENWGVAKPIYREVTVLSSDELEGFDIEGTLEKRQNSRKQRVLFLARIVRVKGIYEAVEAISVLQAKHPAVELVVAGDGEELENVKSYVRDRNISNISFPGYVKGAEKRRILEESQIFLFPTHHWEGLPGAVVEAMAFGLPVITRPVGGLADFFEDGKHGFISDSLNPGVFAGMIEKLLLDKGLCRRISMLNHKYAASHFLAEGAVSRIESIYESISSSLESTDSPTEAGTKSEVVITHPDLEDRGGVSNYWKQLQGRFQVEAAHFTVGKRPGERGGLRRLSRLYGDYRRFMKVLRRPDVRLVHLNPSLDPKAFMRDGIFALLARYRGKKTIVSFHGWQKPFELCISRRLRWAFKLFFGKVDAFIVLSDAFKRKLAEWGITKPVYQEVAVINNESLEGFDIHHALKKRHESRKWRILFLSRILKAKGIYETVQAASLLQAKYPNVELVVAGEGDELENVKRFVQNAGVSNVIFPGYVRGDEKRRLFEEASIFCMPSYSEGFPIAIVEAMAFGLPVITRPVGGITDFFRSEEHGFISDSLSPDVFASLIEKLLIDKSLYDAISLNNHRHAQSHFLASDAASRLDAIYEDVLRNR